MKSRTTRRAFLQGSMFAGAGLLVLRDRRIALGRELTKLHEQCVNAPLGELPGRIEAGEIVQKGEFVIAVAGTDVIARSAIDIDHLLIELSDKLPGKEVAKVLARATGEKRNALYTRLLELSGRGGGDGGED